eukprot:gene8446-6928_t
MAPQLAIPYAAVGAPFAGRMLEKWDKTLQSFAHIKVDTAEAAALQTTIKVGLVEIVKLRKLAPKGELLAAGYTSFQTAADAGMQIFVKSSFHSEVAKRRKLEPLTEVTVCLPIGPKEQLTLPIASDTTCGSIKDAIVKVTGLPLNQLRVFTSDKAIQLKNQQTVAGLVESLRVPTCTLHCILPLDSSVQISVSAQLGGDIQLKVTPAETFESVKLRIEDAVKIPASEQVIFFITEGKRQWYTRTKVGDTMSDYNIREGSTLHLARFALFVKTLTGDGYSFAGTYLSSGACDVAESTTIEELYRTLAEAMVDGTPGLPQPLPVGYTIELGGAKVVPRKGGGGGSGGATGASKFGGAGDTRTLGSLGLTSTSTIVVVAP